MKKTAGLEMTIQLSPIVFKWALSIVNCLRIIGTSIRMFLWSSTYSIWPKHSQQTAGWSPQMVGSFWDTPPQKALNSYF